MARTKEAAARIKQRKLARAKANVSTATHFGTRKDNEKRRKGLYKIPRPAIHDRRGIFVRGEQPDAVWYDCQICHRSNCINNTPPDYKVQRKPYVWQGLWICLWCKQNIIPVLDTLVTKDVLKLTKTHKQKLKNAKRKTKG